LNSSRAIFREEPVIGQIVALVAGGQVDVLLSDMAPNLSGVDAIDQAALDVPVGTGARHAERVLKRDGSALIKVFQGTGFQELVATSRRKFARVRVWKPEASRSRSPELYLLAKGFGLV
jgi:23S rRNA (uridine2552-2'-O)-methyltransferase